MPHLVSILTFDGVDELDLIGPLEVLRRAARLGAPFDVKLCGDGALEFIAAHRVRMKADSPLLEPDILIVPGGGWAAAAPQGVAAEIERGILPAHIARVHARGTVVASVCTGALLLAAGGIVHGRRMTTHRVAREALAKAGALLGDERVVDDGSIISAGGVTSGIDLGLHLVSRFANASLTMHIARAMEYPLS